jgi:hypothetical protein
MLKNNSDAGKWDITFLPLQISISKIENKKGGDIGWQKIKE